MARLGARKTTGVWSPLLRPGTPESIPVAASLYALPGTATVATVRTNAADVRFRTDMSAGPE